MISSGKKLVFMWLPSHVGLGNNKAADAAAKAALGLAAGTVPVPSTDFYASVNRYVRSKWQQAWDAKTNNKLHAIEPAIHGSMSYKLPRRDEIIIHRLRLHGAHARHPLVLAETWKSASMLCVWWSTHGGASFSRIQCTNANTSAVFRRAVFNNVSSRKIVDFIKAIGFYGKLLYLSLF